jgi:hypothetical protein
MDKGNQIEKIKRERAAPQIDESVSNCESNIDLELVGVFR